MKKKNHTFKKYLQGKFVFWHLVANKVKLTIIFIDNSAAHNNVPKLQSSKIVFFADQNKKQVV